MIATSNAGAADESELASSWHHVENSDQSEAQPQGSDVTTAALGETEAQPDQMTPPLTSPDAGVVSSTSLERGKKDAVLSKYGVKAAAEMAAAAMERARREAYRQACGKPDAQLPESQPDSVAPPLTSPNAEVVTPMSSEAGDSIRRSVEERAKAAVEYATQVAKVHDDRMREQEREQVQEKRNAELPETQPNQMTSPLMSETQGVTPLSSDEFWDGFEDRAVVLAELQKAITAGSVAASPEWCEWARAQVEIQAKRDAALPETQPNPVAQLLMPDAGVVPSVSSQEFWERSELGIKSIVDNAKKSDPPVDLAPIQEWRERVMRELEAREELETREDWEAIREAERDRDDWMGVAPPPQHAAAMLALAKSKVSETSPLTLRSTSHYVCSGVV